MSEKLVTTVSMSQNLYNTDSRQSLCVFFASLLWVFLDSYTSLLR